MSADCVFCKIRDGQSPAMKVYEDERTLVFMDINPLNAGHCLVTIRNHAATIWDADDAAGPVVVHAAYSLARALAVRERRVDQSSHAAIAEIERSARAIEKQIGYLDDVRKWAETVKGHGEKIAERSARMADELQRDVDRLDAQVAALRTAEE